MQISWLLNLALVLISPCLTWSFPVADHNSTVNIYSNMSSFSEGAHISKPGCPSKCGNLTVPYPFGIAGIDSSCSIDPFFNINCNASFDPPKAFLSSGNLEVLGISDTKIRIRNQLAWSCFDGEGNYTHYGEFSMNLSGSPFSFSNENKFTLVGCDDFTIMITATDEWDDDYISLCAAICSKPEDLDNGSCSGIGCCQASIPRGLQYFYAAMATFNGHTKVWHFNPCGYSFLGEQNSYTFNISDISDSSFVNRTTETVPVVIDWAIGNQTCNTSEIICQGESVCVDLGRGLGGYRCNCFQGYQGNPYLSQGCQDINECDFNPCHPEATCTNLPGTFSCSCPPNYLGDGTKHGTGCFLLPPPKRTALYAGLFIGFGLFSVLSVSLWLYKLLKKRRIKQLKQNLFKRNGGLLLQQQMSAHDSVLEKMRIFTSKELERATDRFNESRMLGRGGQGSVYKGMLSDGRIVAVKKSKQVDQDQLVEFINEFVILSQINHRNVVKLLGCCLETEVPLLVYEFIPNGTLYDLIHDGSTGLPFSWDLRLRIATEIANALSYLHYATSIPIYHRDIKSNNILLDEKYRAKLSDFGISRLVAIDQHHLTTKVKGTFGYLDPEYFQTGKFTEKSDVYSFGVVLIEVLTGQKPISASTTEDQESSLAKRFLLTMQENSLKTILDPQIIEQGVKEEHVAVADLAKRCLNSNGNRRPTIREVATELESIRTPENLSSVEHKIQDISCTETESYLLSDDGFPWTKNVS